MSNSYSVLLGKFVQKIARLRGGGSALPGLVIEKIDPSFTRNILATLPHGVVIVSGTNGKTTTTKMVVELLEGQGLRVFTNRTGSNFARGVTAALLAEVDYKGALDADIAVLELDEAHAVKFVDDIPPQHALLLNVMRDQLDRFGEIDTTAKMLQHIAKAATKTVTLNREDSRVAAIANDISLTPHYFGLSSALQPQFSSEDERTTSANTQPADVVLQSFSDDKATFLFDSKSITTKLKLRGIYNIFNAAAALATTRAILGDAVDNKKLITSLSTIEPAFGRGETLFLQGVPIDLVLVKNPSGFRLALKSFSPKGYATMIAINDNYADGRDMSWLWDVSFESLKETGVHTISGVRAYDMALRLQYDDVEVSHIDTKISAGLHYFLNQNKTCPKRIFCTYTAMLSIRKELAKLTDIERVL